jgi:UDP-N-acetylmuramoylalanine--D-glutamate ligase
MVNANSAAKPLKIAILGFSREGKAALTYLKKAAGYKDAEITICDKNEQLEKIKKKNISYQLGKDYLENLGAFDLIVRSPGVPYMLPQLVAARQHGTPMTSSTKLFFKDILEFRDTNKLPILIGVTGTKGKGTVCTLVYEILKASKKRVVLAGNIGKPALEILAAAKKAEYVVLELSSFQLQDLDAPVDVAAVLDISPDHLDAHKDMTEYVASKAMLAKSQSKTGQIFYFTGNTDAEKIAKYSKGRQVHLKPEELSLFAPADMKMIGYHSFKNAVMASRITQSLGVADEVIKKVCTAFTGLPHRLEFVARKKTKSGKMIMFYNDSAGTNPETASAAVAAFSIPVVLIAGGKDKGFSYEPLGRAIGRSSTQAVVLFGENREQILKAIKPSGKGLEVINNLEQAVGRAYELASHYADNQQTQVAVVFSPASASFDMFKDYADRGEAFKKFVKILK